MGVQMYLSYMKNKKMFILIFPALIAFSIALIPTLKYQWPLSWDIYYHVHMAKLYMEQGITFFDPLTWAPFGRPIYYPPLFHFLLASLSMLFNMDPFKVARLLQPIFAMLIVLSFSWVAYKFYDLTVGVLAGFFIFFSSIFVRFMLPAPEAMALIVFPVSVYFYYLAVENYNYKYAIISGILAGIILLTHALSALCLFLVISVFTVVMKVSKRKVDLRPFWVFSGCTLAVASIWWLPLLLKYGYVVKMLYICPLEIFKYLNIFGMLSLTFALVGGLLLLKKRRNKDVLILSWLITILVLSESHWLGIPVLSYRIVTFAVFPMMILAGLGIKCVKINKDKRFFCVFVSIICIVAIFSGFSKVDEFKCAPSWLRASDSELDIANWFKLHGDKEKVVITSNYRIDTLIVSIARQPVSQGGYGQGTLKMLSAKKYIEGKVKKSDLIKNKIGYFVLNVKAKAPPYSKLVYQNDEYKIYLVDNLLEKG